METSESQFEYDWGKITSKDDSLDDFLLLYLVARRREDISERWIMFWKGKAISFAETLRQSEWEETKFTSDGRRIVVINKMGMPDRFTYSLVPYDVPWFESFSSNQEQSEFINLFLDAMSACEHYIIPHKGKKCVAIIGDEFQNRLDKGVYLQSGPKPPLIWKTLLLVILSSPKKILLRLLVMLSPLICLMALFIVRINSGT